MTRTPVRDVPVAAATLALVVVTCWKMGLALLAPEPSAAIDIVRDVGGIERAAGDEMLASLSGAADGLLPAAAADTARSPLPRRTLRVEPGTPEHARLRHLLRSFGYADEPVLITLDPEGHVIRVRQSAERP